MKRICLAAAVLFAATSAEAAKPKRLHTIRFSSSGSALSIEEQTKLEQVARQIDSGELAAIRLIGHTDRHGSPVANLALGLRRARAVADQLVGLGVPRERIYLESAGETSLLDRAQTRAADALNRRVEVWLATREREVDGPSAWISWILNDVQMKSTADPEWLAARLEAELEPLDRVRTLEASAAEITFRTLDRLRLGEDALLVFNRSPKDTRTSQRLADIELQEGTLLARLAGKQRRLSLRSPSASVDLRSARARIQHDPKTTASVVSIYEGRAKVAAMGASVDVNEGFGTRVREGRRPEKPTALPPPPAWTDEAPMVLLVGRTSTLEWRLSGSSASAVVEVLRDEAGTGRLIRTLRAANRVDVPELPPGLYRALIRGKDERGLVGDQSAPRPIVVLEPSKPAAEAPSGESNVVRLDAPGTIELAVPDGVRLISDTGTIDDGRWSVTLDRAGRFDLPFALEEASGQWRASDRLTVVVDPPPAPPPPAPPPPAPTPVVETPKVELRPGLGARGGASIAFIGGGAPTAFLDYGWPVRLDGDVYLRLGPEAGWSRVAGADGSLQVIPLHLRAALDIDAGRDRLYLGAAGGLALAIGQWQVDVDRRIDMDTLQPSWRLFLGLGHRLTSDLEGELELAYTRMRLFGDEDFDESQMMLLLGLRWLAP